MSEPDVLVLGSGIGGLMAALKAAQDAQVLVLTKKRAEDANTNFAQGGIAAVFDPHDSFRAHQRDTLRLGAGLSDPAVVRDVVRDAPERVRELEALGVDFSRTARGYALGREGGHSFRRIVHASDFTGQAIERALVERARSHPRIRMLEDQLVVDLILESRMRGGRRRGPDTCWGAYVMDRVSGAIRPMVARATILATGGCGKVYLYTTNPDVATGDGLAMAYRAGAQVANLEFVQFHPTCLYHPRAKSFLLSEALRGEGARLRTLDGTRFMPLYHRQAELAPRDVVARAIDREMKRRGEPHVWLDISHRPGAQVRARFPNIAAALERYGLDLTREPIPVVPAAHYMCGGVIAKLSGRTALDGLFAIGEVACTGLHGANRLASNSLLEALVGAHRAAADVRQHLLGPARPPRLAHTGRAAAPRDRALRPQLGRRAARDVGFGRDRAHRRAARDRCAATRPAARADRGRLRSPRARARSDRATQHRARGQPDRGVRDAPPGEPGPPLQPRSPTAGGRALAAADAREESCNVSPPSRRHRSVGRQGA